MTATVYPLAAAQDRVDRAAILTRARTLTATWDGPITFDWHGSTLHVHGPVTDYAAYLLASMIGVAIPSNIYRGAWLVRIDDCPVYVRSENSGGDLDGAA